mmetsp:Transcript_21810/g.64674  ORF Transcript_21810/g.64674 Transcript_21810/m.64674 type:complete len:308 (+) Transcript_21810:1225-2148(+)
MTPASTSVEMTQRPVPSTAVTTPSISLRHVSGSPKSGCISGRARTSPLGWLLRSSSRRAVSASSSTGSRGAAGASASANGAPSPSLLDPASPAEASTPGSASSRSASSSPSPPSSAAAAAAADAAAAAASRARSAASRTKCSRSTTGSPRDSPTILACEVKPDKGAPRSKTHLRSSSAPSATSVTSPTPSSASDLADCASFSSSSPSAVAASSARCCASLVLCSSKSSCQIGSPGSRGGSRKASPSKRDVSRSIASSSRCARSSCVTYTSMGWSVGLMSEKASSTASPCGSTGDRLSASVLSSSRFS